MPEWLFILLWIITIVPAAMLCSAAEKLWATGARKPAYFAASAATVLALSAWALIFLALATEGAFE